MNVNRQSAHGRALLVVTVAVALALAACGGSSKAKSEPTTASGGGGGGNTTTSAGGPGGNGNCYTTPGTQKARVRFVNFFTNDTYKAGAIDVYQGSSGTDPCGKKLATVQFGTASDYVDVTAGDSSGNWDSVAYVAGSTAKDHQIIQQSETWQGGEQVTIVFAAEESQAGSGLPASAGSDQAFFEKGTGSNEPSVKPVAGKAVLGIAATSLQTIVKDGAWLAGIEGQTACLKTEGDTDSTRTNIGGTQLVPYTVDPGSPKVGLFKAIPGTCTGTPDIGPESVDATAGSITYVFAYGADPQSLKLLVLPVPA